MNSYLTHMPCAVAPKAPLSLLSARAPPHAQHPRKTPCHNSLRRRPHASADGTLYDYNIMQLHSAALYPRRWCLMHHSFVVLFNYLIGLSLVQTTCQPPSRWRPVALRGTRLKHNGGLGFDGGVWQRRSCVVLRVEVMEAFWWAETLTWDSGLVVSV